MDKPVVLTKEEIVAGIREGTCVKAVINNFDHAAYYLDLAGHVYSMRNPGEPKCIDQKMGDGLMYVALFSRDGDIKRHMVGDLMAWTFLDREPRDNEETTVVYNDGNAANNARDNLQWGTPLAQQEQLRIAHSTSSPPLPPHKKPSPTLDQLLSQRHNEKNAPSVVITAESDPMIDRLHALQAREEAAKIREKQLLEALQPFASFILSPNDSVSAGGTVIVEANKGRQQHSTLTVHHFRLAAEAFKPPK